MSNLLDLSDKIALVTGSSRGIGKELALELAEGGAKVAIHYLKSEELAKKTVEEIRLKGVEVIKVKSDIRDPKGVEYIFEEIENKLGSVDILINNVGDHAPKHWEDIDFETSTLHIPITKNGHSRTIPLTEEAGGILKALPQVN